MKVGFVTASISRRAGGLFYSVRGLAEELAKQHGGNVDVHGLIDCFSAVDIEQWNSLVPRLYPRVGPYAIGYSPAMFHALAACDCDLLHTHGIWQLTSSVVHRWHVKTGKPYLISPRGMLDPWALSRSRAKKWIASLWFESAHLRDASCLHALCRSEAESMRQFGVRSPICVIPNGVELPKAIEGSAEKRGRSSRPQEDVKTLVFISRIHPKKGLPGALRAWASFFSSRACSERPKWRLVIAGWDQQGHETELQGLCAQLGILHHSTAAFQFLAGDDAGRSPGSVTFVGPVYGELKDKLLREASAFILPSFSEGLPMAVLEAWAYCLPVLMTVQCNLPEGFDADAAIPIGTDAASITAGLQTLFAASDFQRRLWGENGRRLVKARFAWPQIARQMLEVYRWVLRDGPRPDCVLCE